MDMNDSNLHILLHFTYFTTFIHNKLYIVRTFFFLYFTYILFISFSRQIIDIINKILILKGLN